MGNLLHSYAAPLMALDQVISCDADHITTRKAIAGNEPFFIGHYPHQPIYPGVFIVEAVHQAVRQYATTQGWHVRLIEVRSTRFLAPLQPGDVLESDCRCALQPDNQTIHVRAVCRSSGKDVAEIKLMFRREDFHA